MHTNANFKEQIWKKRHKFRRIVVLFQNWTVFFLAEGSVVLQVSKTSESNVKVHKPVTKHVSSQVSAQVSKQVYK